MKLSRLNLIILIEYHIKNFQKNKHVRVCQKINVYINAG